jgi:hypothetical protein
MRSCGTGGIERCVASKYCGEGNRQKGLPFLFTLLFLAMTKAKFTREIGGGSRVPSAAKAI